ncbi:MAG: hypothetical protein NTY19_22720 [Planctomycetota bacterium]|nr:hypothetical protein [Planctomycetota bacterium]
MYICSSGDVPPWLLSRWVGTWQPAWSGDLTLDANLEMALMSALSSNQPELLARSLGYVESLLPDWRENAKKLYGCRGILSCIRAGRNGLHHHWDSGWALQNWTAGAGWIGSWFYDYYRYTGDKEFLAKRCVPYLKEIALFYEDFLLLDESGKYRFSPSYSPETAALDNATMDIAVARKVLTNLIAASVELGIERENTDKWRAMLARLPDYMINGPENEEPAIDPSTFNRMDQPAKPIAGTVKEFALPGSPNFYEHRHFSHYYPVIYSYEVTPERNPKLWEAFNRTLTARMNAKPDGVPAFDTLSFGRMHAALAAAYLRRGEDVWKMLSHMVHGGMVFTNMHTSCSDGHGLSCFDGSGPLPAVVNNSLIFRRGIAPDDAIDLLPALPVALPKGRIEGILLRGQIRVDSFEWDTAAKKICLTLNSAKPQDVILRLPNAPAIKEINCSTGNATIAGGTDAQSRNLRLAAGAARFQIAY